MNDLSERALKGRTSDGFERLFDMLEALEPEHLELPVAGGWTVSGLLAHLAFWDCWVVARWDRFEQRGRFDDLPDGIDDLVNAAAMPEWLALPPARSLELLRRAAAEVTRRIESLPSDAVRAASQSGRPAMVDRTLHWHPHLDEISRALSGELPGASPGLPPDPSG
jgi:Mycothiol maleylpyruvate isomerase N-terminal domain